MILIFSLEEKYQIFLLKITLLLLNVIILISNIYLFLKSIENPIFNLEFKNVDYFNFLKSQNIYKTNKEDFNRNKKIKISFNCVDTHGIIISNDLLKNWFQNQTNFIFEVNTENPDFLIFDVFGKKNLNPKYKDSVKIAYYTENSIPDLNYADFAISQAHIMYLDRYIKYPDFIFALSKIKNYDIVKIRNNVSNKSKNKFCAAVISDNFVTTNFRFTFFNELNKYKKIDMGGRVLNNVGEYVEDKIKFLSSYKFSFSMENSEGDGYISEKIIDSFLAGTIPIYYGDYMFDEFINPKSIILIRGEKDIKQKIEYIKKIDNDDKLYKKILKEKIFNENFQKVQEQIHNEKTKFLENIFLHGKMNAKRVDKTYF